MNLLSKKKPVLISMSDTAASGGYYMAMTGDPIVAYPGTLTGSIGVVFGKPNLHGLYDKVGVTKDAIQRGKHAEIDSDYTRLPPALPRRTPGPAFRHRRKLPGLRQQSCRGAPSQIRGDRAPCAGTSLAG